MCLINWKIFVHSGGLKIFPYTGLEFFSETLDLCINNMVHLSVICVWNSVWRLLSLFVFCVWTKDRVLLCTGPREKQFLAFENIYVLHNWKICVYYFFQWGCPNFAHLTGLGFLSVVFDSFSFFGLEFFTVVLDSVNLFVVWVKVYIALLSLFDIYFKREYFFSFSIF